MSTLKEKLSALMVKLNSIENRTGDLLYDIRNTITEIEEQIEDHAIAEESL